MPRVAAGCGGGGRRQVGVVAPGGARWLVRGLTGVVARLRLRMVEQPDFRSDRMESPEGKGIARQAWDAYAGAVTRVSRPAVEPLARKLAGPVTVDLFGFWLAWQLEGGFEGLRRLGMSRASIYRRIKLFRIATGVHPDEFQLPGVTLDVAAYHSPPAAPQSSD